jgi:hypothetical protein
MSPCGGTPYITPFQRALNVSSLLFEPAQHKPLFKTTYQSGSFIVKNDANPPINLALSKFREAARSSTNDFKACIEAALPSGVSVYDIPTDRITDDFSSSALHRQPQNVDLLQPLIPGYWNKVLAGVSGGQPLFDQCGVVRIEVDRWLEVYDKCYPSAASAMILNSGGLDAISFKHYCYDGPRRNIFLLKNGSLSFTNPLSSHRHTSSHLDLVVMPSEMTRLLLVLIVILLPIAHKLRTLKGQLLPFHSTHLWVLPRRHTSGNMKWHFTSNDANKDLQVLTQHIFGVALNGQLIRKMVHQVLSSELPLLFSNDMHLRSPVDDLAQHSFITGIHNYGVLMSFPPLPMLIGDKPVRNVVCCEIWQALIDVGPVNESWRAMVSGTVFFPVPTFREDALCAARRLVLMFYKIHNTDRAIDRVNLVQSVLSAKPFLRGIAVGICGDLNFKSILTERWHSRWIRH